MLDGETSNNVTHTEINQLFTTIDTDGNGLIDFSEFQSFYEAVLSGSTTMSMSLMGRISTIGIGIAPPDGSGSGGENRNMQLPPSAQTNNLLQITRTVTDINRASSVDENDGSCRRGSCHDGEDPSPFCIIS